jgi:hypothetical protein
MPRARGKPRMFILTTQTILHANNEELLWDIGSFGFSETTVHLYDTVHHGYVSFHLDPRLFTKQF